MVSAVFLCFFHLLVSCHFMFVFLKFWAKFAWHHSFVHVARAYSEMHLFKCWWWFRYSEMAFFTHFIYFFALDFSHGKYIMLHEATAKLMFLVCFVFSLQRGAPFLMYGMVDSSFIHKQWVVCVCIRRTAPVQEGDTDSFFFKISSLERDIGSVSKIARLVL